MVRRWLRVDFLRLITPPELTGSFLAHVPLSSVSVYLMLGLQMHNKMIDWRDTGPGMDGGAGLNKVWYVTALGMKCSQQGGVSPRTP